MALIPLTRPTCLNCGYSYTHTQDDPLLHCCDMPVPVRVLVDVSDAEGIQTSETAGGEGSAIAASSTGGRAA